MEVLPIRFIREEDAPLVGVNLVALAKLKQLGFAVPDGVVVLPPDILLRTILEHYQYKNKELFEQSLVIIKKDFESIPVPGSLLEINELKDVDLNDLWKNLIKVWFDEIRSSIWREGFKDPLKDLTSQPIFFTQKIVSSGNIYIGEGSKVFLDIEVGRLNEEEQKELGEMVRSANRKLYMPYIYQWVLGKRLEIVKLHPYTQDETLEERVVEVEKKVEVEERKVGSAVKVFFDLSSKLTINEEMDGVLIKGEGEGGFDVSSGLDRLDFRNMQLVEASMSLDPKPVIFRLSDKQGLNSDVRGALNLLHNTKLLEADCQSFEFAGKVKGRLNVELGIPMVRSVKEYQDIRRKLESMGVLDKGSRVWLEMAVPENLLNISEYIKANLGGVVLNLDELGARLGGFSKDFDESYLYSGQLSVLEQFIEGGVKLLHKNQIPVLAMGEVLNQDEMLRFLLKLGVWGVVFEIGNMESIKEQVSFIEKHNFKSLLL